MKEWLQTYMLKSQKNRRKIANGVATWLADDHVHLSHGRAITRDELVRHGLNISELENDQAFQDAILSVHRATMLTFGSSGAIKIIENHLGRAFVQHGGQMTVTPIQSPPIVPGN